jgi:hypothetical protein
VAEGEGEAAESAEAEGEEEEEEGGAEAEAEAVVYAAAAEEEEEGEEKEEGGADGDKGGPGGPEGPPGDDDEALPKALPDKWEEKGRTYLADVFNNPNFNYTLDDFKAVYKYLRYKRKVLGKFEKLLKVAPRARWDKFKKSEAQNN